MSRTDRDLLAGAKTLLASLTDEWKTHLKVCRQCQNLTPTANRYCPDGWEIRLEMTAASKRIAQLTPPPIQGQDGLF